LLIVQPCRRAGKQILSNGKPLNVYELQGCEIPNSVFRACALRWALQYANSFSFLSVKLALLPSFASIGSFVESR
jgi:hypothetical protein